MSNRNWETRLITKAINKVLSDEPKHHARRKSIKQQQDTSNSSTFIIKKH